MKIAIVDKNTGATLHIYESNEPNISKFGGPWGNPGQVEHIPVPNDLADELAYDLVPEMVQVQVGTVRQPCLCDQGQPIKKQAFDSEGNPIMDASGNQVELQTYIEVPVFETVKSLRKRRP
jgi:hypothetical protein